MAVASSSKNANGMMRSIRFDSGEGLLDIFERQRLRPRLASWQAGPGDFPAGGGGVARSNPHSCLVVEDAPAGIEAARAGGMVALGVARHDDAALLRAAGADLVVTSLDEVAIDALAHGRLRGRPT